MHIQDLEHFTSTYVNDKFRKVCMKVYARVQKYPRQFPRIKKRVHKMELETADRESGHCNLPPGIRTVLSHKYGNVYNFMLELESAMSNLNRLASTVVEDIDLKTRWVAEADIGLMSKVFSVNKSLRRTRSLAIELRKQCSELIATKILELQKLIESETPPDALFVFLVDCSALSIAV